jgi:hypothetical protein
MPAIFRLVANVASQVSSLVWGHSFLASDTLG